jgi:hypothetical protein
MVRECRPPEREPVELLAGAPLDDWRHVNPQQAPTQPPASSPSDLLRRSPPHAWPYATPSFFRRFWFGPEILRTDPGPCRKRPLRAKLRMARGKYSRFLCWCAQALYDRLDGGTVGSAEEDLPWVRG